MHQSFPQYPMKNILIVDDDTVFLHSLEEMLKMIDGPHRIYTAENGEQAAAIISTIAVDLLITDLRMPVMSGEELIHRIRMTHPDLPIVVISACALAPAMQELGKLNCRYFDKPINVNELISTVRELM
jgi:YesN/AraC family two-component response regulator